MTEDRKATEEDRMKAEFISEYAQHGIIGSACRAIGIPRSVYRRWAQEDDVFLELCQDAVEDSVDLAEAEFRKRAVTGIEEVVIWQGQPVWKRDPTTGHVLLDDDFEPIPLTVTTRSDKLLDTYMKGMRAKFSNKIQHEHTGAGGGPLKAVIEFVGSDEGRPVHEGEGHDGASGDDVTGQEA